MYNYVLFVLSSSWILPPLRKLYNVSYQNTIPLDYTCTDEILIADVNSHKTSLANNYMCLKMYCYKCAC